MDAVDVSKSKKFSCLFARSRLNDAADNEPHGRLFVHCGRTTSRILARPRGHCRSVIYISVVFCSTANFLIWKKARGSIAWRRDPDALAPTNVVMHLVVPYKNYGRGVQRITVYQ